MASKRRFARKKKMDLREVLPETMPDAEDPLLVIRRLESQLAQERYTSNRRLAEQDNELQKLKSRNRELEREVRKLGEKVKQGLEPYEKKITELQEEKCRLKKSLKVSSRKLQEALRVTFRNKNTAQPAEEKSKAGRMSRRKHKKEIRENAWITTERSKFPFSAVRAEEESEGDTSNLLVSVNEMNIHDDDGCPEQEETEVTSVDSLGNVWLTRAAQKEEAQKEHSMIKTGK